MTHDEVRKSYITTAEAAIILRTPPQTFRNAIRDGRLDAMKLGKTWLIARYSFNDFKNSFRKRKD